MSARRKQAVLVTGAVFGFLLPTYYIFRVGDIPRIDNTEDRLPSTWKEDSSVKSPPVTQQPSTTPTTTQFNIPSEYTDRSDDQDLCKRFYTGEYLHEIATHQQPYCQAGSLGALQCFTAPRLPPPWTSDWKADPLCVAQGVRYAPGQPPLSPSSKRSDFQVQCQPRNFAEERLASEQAARELHGVPELSDLGVYWFDTGAGATLRTWRFEEGDDAAGCTKENNNGEWILLARREHNVNLWHKLMEIWQARHTVDALRMAINPSRNGPWLSEDQFANMRVVFDDDREEPLDPLWTIVTGNEPIRMSSLRSGTCFANVIIPLAGSSSPFWSALLEKNHHETCRMPTLLTTFVNRVLAFYNITPRLPSTTANIRRDPSITIINRTHNRKFINLDSWTASLQQRYPNSRITVVDFAILTIEEQLRLVQDTDVLVGHHGAGMTHVMFLPPEAAAVEILPPWFPMRGFRSVARMRGVTHFAGRGMWEEEWEYETEGKPLPEGWVPPRTEAGWQEREWTYLMEEEFLGLVDAAVRNQVNRLNDG